MNSAYHKAQPAECRYNTPQWAAEEIVARHLRVGPSDLVIEPSCGPGQFLQAIPHEIQAIGVELESELAEQARRLTGRQVITGDFRTVALPSPAAIIGNPPFALALVEAFLERAHRLLPKDGFCGFILPAYALQNGNRVSAWHARWGLVQEMLPRQLFPGLAHPIVFATFIKGRTELFQGFGLYREYSEMQDLSKQHQVLLQRAETGSVWHGFVKTLLQEAGRPVTLEELYRQAARRDRPTENRWWKEKIRQTLARYEFPRDGQGYYADPAHN